jgi:multimeric flavodoxin WrbA
MHKKLLIIYYSYTGGTEQMAQAAFDAAECESEIETLLVRAEDCEAEDLLAADGYIFATPENLAAIAGVMKAFFDRCYYPVLGKIEGRPYSAMICAGSDGENALAQVERIAKGWRLKKCTEPIIICTHAQSEAAIMAPKQLERAGRNKCADLGATMAAGMAVGVF